MKYRHLGKAGIQVSELSLGSWVTFHTQSGVSDAAMIMAAAYDKLGMADLAADTRRVLSLNYPGES